MYELKFFVDQQEKEYTLTHIDAVPDNFLFVTDDQGQEDIRLIDWEYAGMQDPHVDIAMFAIYSLYSKEQIDELIGMYFTEGCNKETRIKIYCYIAAGGLLWSNWCEYEKEPWGRVWRVFTLPVSLCERIIIKFFWRRSMKVNNAIVMAAGTASRFAPLSI